MRIVLPSARPRSPSSKEADLFRHKRKQKPDKKAKDYPLPKTKQFLKAKVENLRFSPFEFNFCLLFPFSSLDVCIYASRSRTKNSAQNPPSPSTKAKQSRKKPRAMLGALFVKRKPRDSRVVQKRLTGEKKSSNVI